MMPSNPHPAAPRLSGPGEHAPARVGRRRLGEILVDEGLITEEQLHDALSNRQLDPKRDRRERLGETIVRLGYADEGAIARALASQLSLQFLPGEQLVAEEAAVNTVPAGLAERHGILPLKVEKNGTLVVGCADPTNVVAMDDVRLASGAREIRPVVVSALALEVAIRRAYGFDQNAAGDLIDALDDTRFEAEEEDPTQSASDAPVIRLAEGIITGALETDASDIHVEPGSDGTVVRYRIDGVLQQRMKVPKSANSALISRLKIMSGMDIAEKRRPQDGRSRVRTSHWDVDLRVSTLPSMFGETMVIRLLRKGAEQLQIDDVGFTPEQKAQILGAVDRPQGLVLITGPTGSGKTSTLYSFLSHLADESRNIITLEDPVEYQLDSVNQTQINDQIGLTFGKALRTVLRQDPDVVMVGEMRDPETAELGLQASLTGHLVFSTLHTNDAPGAVVRLRDLGIAPYLIASSMTMVVAQRLVRRICSRCAIPVKPTERQIKHLNLPRKALEQGGFMVGTGCSMCSQTGYRGRLGLFEVLAVDASVRQLISTGASESAIRHAARVAGMKSLREDGIAKAMAGVTSLEEVLRVTPVDTEEEGACPTCAELIDDDYAVCPWCGTNLRADACGKCERPLVRGWVMCPTCGTPTGDGHDHDSELPKLLVVDDDPALRAEVVAMLDTQFQVVEAACGREALDAVHHERPEVVLLDVGLADLDGYSVTRELRSRPSTMHLPVILLTVDADPASEIEGLRAGADDHLLKPLHRELLLSRVNGLLRRVST
jgi:type IV pilus assembly protein PilB